MATILDGAGYPYRKQPENSTILEILSAISAQGKIDTTILKMIKDNMKKVYALTALN